jgi:integrase
MPLLYEMTWIKATRQWQKRHNRRLYAVSIRQLRAAFPTLPIEPTKEGSRDAANLWWQRKKAELTLAEDARPSLDPASAQVQSVLRKADVSHLEQLVAQGKAAEKFLAILGAASIKGEVTQLDDGFFVGPMPMPERAARALERNEPLPAHLIDQILAGEPLPEDERNQTLRRLGKVVLPDRLVVDPDRTLGAQAKAWGNFQLARARAGNISPGRFDAYRRNLQPFIEFCGGENEDVGVIDALRLKGFYEGLCEKIEGEAYSPAYCKNLLGAAKNFICYLTDLGLIPLPGNIRSRFGFAEGVGNKTRYTVQEVKGVLEAAVERTRLYLLLMLNCGMYQSDIADLRQEEVDWSLGTVRRKRSKTRRIKNAPEVRYKLWPETFSLLQKHRSQADWVLVSDEGNKLVDYGLANGKLKRYDLIEDGFRRARVKAGVDKPLKSFRKTSANLLEGHPVYQRFVRYLLGQAPASVAERHYVDPSDELFAQALAWLREQLFAPARVGGDRPTDDIASPAGSPRLEP